MGCAQASSVNSDFFALDYHFKLEQQLGGGGFGKVWACQHRATGEDCVVKIVPFQCMDSDFVLREDSKFLRARATEEIIVWKHVGEHEHIVQLMDSFVDNSRFFMVMERCACSLEQAYPQIRGFDANGLSALVRGLLLALRHVHQANVVHLDVKPANFMLGGPEGQTVKLRDFGLAVYLDSGEALAGAIGTLAFMSPEVLGERPYGTKTDLWSLGATVYHMLLGVHPYLGVNNQEESMKCQILEGSPAPSYSTAIAMQSSQQDALELVRLLLIRDAAARPAALEALQHWATIGSDGLGTLLALDTIADVENVDSKLDRTMSDASTAAPSYHSSGERLVRSAAREL